MLEINENMKRNIDITLSLLDEMLCLFDRWVKKEEYHSLLFEEVNTLTDKQCGFIADEIIKIRLLLKQMNNDLNLHKHTKDVASSIIARCVLFISDALFSLQRKELASSGKVPEQVIAYLDPKATALIKHLERIEEIVNKS